MFGGHLVARAYWLGRLPCTGITLLRSTPLASELQRYYASFRLPECSLPPSPIQLLGHTRPLMIGCQAPTKNLKFLTGCLADVMCNVNGRRLRVSSRSLPAARRKVMPPRVHKSWAGTNRHKTLELPPFAAAWPHAVRSSSLPCCGNFNCRLRRKTLNTTTATLDTGPWASGYPGGIPPARRPDLAGPRVHGIINWEHRHLT